VFYRQHNPASRQEKAVAISLHFKGMFASRPMKRIIPSLNVLCSFSSSLFCLFSADSNQRPKIEDEDEHNWGSEDLWSPSLKISAKT
jgi:hypothetical protein